MLKRIQYDRAQGETLFHSLNGLSWKRLPMLDCKGTFSPFR